MANTIKNQLVNHKISFDLEAFALYKQPDAKD